MILESFRFEHNEAEDRLLAVYHQGEHFANADRNLTGARAMYEQGIASYHALPEEEQTNAVQLVLARTLRDDAFAKKKLQLQGGLDETTPEPLERLNESRRITENLLGLSKDGGVLEFGGRLARWRVRRLARRNEDLGHLIAEHGATVGGIGRLIAKELVDKGTLDEEHTLTKAERQEVRKATRDFGRNQAYGFDVLGNDAHYRTSNAMNGPRVEMAMGGVTSRLRHMAPWFGRTAMSLRFAVMNDQGNVLPSLRTTGRLLLDLRSRKAAIRGIRNHF